MPTKRVIFITLAVVAIFIGFWLGRPPVTEEKSVDVPRIARALLELREERLCPKAGGPPFTGIIYEQTTNGKLLTELPAKEGKVHGIARGWHENGQLEVEEPFENGVSNGIRTRWYANGKKRSTATIVNGVLEGPFTEWHENGQLARQMNLAEGKGEGLCEAWNPDGTLKSKVILKNGEPVKTEYFTSTGTP